MRVRLADIKRIHAPPYCGAIISPPAHLNHHHYYSWRGDNKHGRVIFGEYCVNIGARTIQFQVDAYLFRR
jgi:hypothetical protein